MKADFNGKTYAHEMIAERQREVWIGITALRMMQAHYGNPYIGFKCVRDAERDEWYRKAKAIAPPISNTEIMEGK